MTLGILALDLATSTGWALRDRNGVVTSGVQTFDLRRGESAGMRFLRCQRWLHEVLADPMATSMSLGLKSNTIHRDGCLVDVVAFERAHHRGGSATEVGVGLMTSMMSVAAAFKVETMPVHTATLKKFATGKGNAGKDDMVKAAVRFWGDKHLAGRREPGDDEADALCVLAWAIDELEVPTTRTDGGAS